MSAENFCPGYRGAVDRLFLDANVLFTAAHNPNGKAAFLFKRSNARHWQLVSSRYAVEEARRNIVAKYPLCTERFGELLGQLSQARQPPLRPTPIDLPAKDQPIFLAAQAAKASHLLTGDLKHFGPYMNRADASEGLVIQTVSDYLASL